MKFGEKLKTGQDELATSKNALGLYLDRAAAESPEAMRQKYMDYLSQNKTSFGGGGPALSGGLAQKLQAQSAEQVGDISDSRQRNMPLEYAERMVEPQQLMDMRARSIMGAKAAEQQRAAERKARKSAGKGGIGGIAGSIGGAVIGNMIAPGVGGAVGAGIGGGVGGLLGGG